MTKIQEPQLRAVRTWLNTRPDLLLAIAKRHTTNPLLSPLPGSSTSSSSSSTLNLSVPIGSPTSDTLRVKVSTRARNVEVDIPLPQPQESQKGLPITAIGVRRTIKEMGRDAFKHFKVPTNPAISRFHLPRYDRTLVVLPMTLLFYLAFAPDTYQSAVIGRSVVSKYLGKWMIPIALFILAASHLVIEPIWLISDLRKYQVPLRPSLLYLLVVVLIGYGGIEALQNEVIEERVRLLHSKSTELKKAQ
ncbi:hypothetical protein IAR55_002553 [Kwoniella newhampshirensis]|uniref:Uncharacterized protein n=1 Tax=Kwoniella newhampshirensis TaxID=1651941 RepID=A0AAW0Z1T4_9TREE